MSKYIEKWQSVVNECELLLSIMPKPDEYEKEFVTETPAEFLQLRKPLDAYVSEMENGEFYHCDKDCYSFSIIPEKLYSSDSEFRVITTLVSKIGTDKTIFEDENMACVDKEWTLEQICDSLKATIQMTLDTHKGFIANK
jgi:hypothetical protein